MARSRSPSRPVRRTHGSALQRGCRTSARRAPCPREDGSPEHREGHRRGRSSGNSYAIAQPDFGGLWLDHSPNPAFGHGERLSRATTTPRSCWTFASPETSLA